MEHPIELINEISKNKSNIKELELGVYTYIPRHLDNPRRIIRVSPKDIQSVHERLYSEIVSNEEIAFHSRVYIESELKDRIRHIPLIDFKGRDIACIGEMIEDIISEYGFDRAFLFNSGRSYHLYIPALLTHDEWNKFMGRILLFNFPERPELVDTRWVAYSLRVGYSALRWTNNTPQYLSEPRKERAYYQKQSSFSNIGL